MEGTAAGKTANLLLEECGATFADSTEAAKSSRELVGSSYKKRGRSKSWALAGGLNSSLSDGEAVGLTPNPLFLSKAVNLRTFLSPGTLFPSIRRPWDRAVEESLLCLFGLNRKLVPLENC